MSKTISAARPATLQRFSRRRPARARRALAALELATGATAVAGGALLAAAPDGSLLKADPAVLAGTPPVGCVR